MGTPDLLNAAYQNNVQAITTTSINNNNQVPATNEHQIVPSSSSNNNTPAALNSAAGQHILVGDRFRFDAISIGNQQQQQAFNRQSNSNYQPTTATICSNGPGPLSGCRVAADDLNYHYCPRGSLHSHSIHQHLSNQTLPHTSCASIPQNLSTTSDQQPLIVDTQSDKCLHQQLLHQHHLHGAYNNQQQVTILPSHHHYHHQSQNDLVNNHQCCLRTTSFMANNQPACTCYEQEFFITNEMNKPAPNNNGLNSNNNHTDDYIIRDGCSKLTGGDGLIGLGAIYRATGAASKEEQDYPRSRTLTRVYKPLNDVQQQSQAGSTNNLIDNLSTTFQTKIVTKSQIK